MKRMKEIAPTIMKFILAAIFIYNINLPAFFNKIKDDSPPPPYKADRGRADIDFLNKMLKKAESLGDRYTPELYFADLTKIRMKEQKNDFDYYAKINVNFFVTDLCNLNSENLRYHRVKDSDEKYDQLMQRLKVARDEHLAIIDPGYKEREAEFSAKLHTTAFWMTIPIALANFYLRNFFLALILLWLWWYQETGKVQIKNPLSFILCLIFYPITVIRVWCKSLSLGSREWALEIELRKRQKTIFSMISEDELADIRRIARSNFKISDYRRYLDNRGLVRRQALVPVMVITLLCLIIPRVQGCEINKVVTNEYHLEIQTPPGSYGGHEDYDDAQTMTSAVINTNQFMFYAFLGQRIELPPAPRQRLGFRTNPDPVPLIG